MEAFLTPVRLKAASSRNGARRFPWGRVMLSAPAFLIKKNSKYHARKEACELWLRRREACACR